MVCKDFHQRCLSVSATLLLTLVFSAGILSPRTSFAQCKVFNNAFTDNETIDYDLYFQWGILWKKIGEARFQTHATTYQSQPAYKVDLLAATGKSLDNIFKLRDTLSCYVTRDLVPLYFEKAAEEGKRYSVDAVTYSYSGGHPSVDQLRRRLGAEPYATHFEDTRCIYDMMSLIVRARNDNFSLTKPKDQVKLPLASGRRLDEVTLVYEGIKTIKGKDKHTYRCKVYRCLILTERDDKAKEIMTFYVTDDENCIPVMIDLALNFGSAKAYLRSAQGTRHPITSIVD